MITEEMRKYRNNIRYKVDTLVVLFNDGSTIEVEPGMITSIYIEKDFDNLYFPIINLSVVIDDELYNRITNENETVKFRLRINKLIYDANNIYIKYELLFNELFICFSNKEVIIKDKKSIQNKKEIEHSVATQNTRANTRNFYLFKEDVIKCKKNMNLSIKKSTIQDLVLYMFNKANIDKLLMSIPDNLNYINNLLIPNSNLIESLLYVNELKGFFNRGLLLFFDVDTAYFIDKSSKCTSWRKNEVRITHLHVSDDESFKSKITGEFVDKDRKSSHIFTNTNSTKIFNVGLLNDQLSGNNIVVVNNKSNRIDNINPDTTQIGDSNIKYLTTKEDNEFSINEIKYRMEENECVIQTAILSVDIDTMTPNKEFLITFSSSELNKLYGGNYRISKEVFILKKDGENLINTSECIFKKQK